MDEEANQIAEYYLDPDTAVEEINIKGPVRKACLKKIREGKIDRDLFQSCFNDVMKLMERDSFKRFKQSTLFQEFLEEGETYVEDNRKRLSESNSIAPMSRASARLSQIKGMDMNLPEVAAMALEEAKVEQE